MSSWGRRCPLRRQRLPPAKSGSSAAIRWPCSPSSATTPETTSTTGWRSAGQPIPPRLPRIFLVNWFRRGSDGGFLWPGFGDNSRVLKWAIERLEGTAAAIETPIGFVPAPESLDIEGLDVTRGHLSAALAVDSQEWAQEIDSIDQWYARFGDSLPPELPAELQRLKNRFAARRGTPRISSR